MFENYSKTTITYYLKVMGTEDAKLCEVRRRSPTLPASARTQYVTSAPISQGFKITQQNLLRPQLWSVRTLGRTYLIQQFLADKWLVFKTERRPVITQAK